MSSAQDCLFLQRVDGEQLAYRHVQGKGPGVVFCPGFHSDMQGDKALALAKWCENRGRQFTCFDYFGHGQSSGNVAKGRIGRWIEDTITILDEVTEGPQVLVGSSMGGWMMLHAACARPDRIAGLIGIASAPDFTRFMLERRFDQQMLQRLQEQGFVELPSHYEDGQPLRIEQDFIEEAEAHMLLDLVIPIDVPVRLLHGQADMDVPWERSLEIADKLRSEDIEVQLVKDGDHRLSRPQDLQRLLVAIELLLHR